MHVSLFCLRFHVQRSKNDDDDDDDRRNVPVSMTVLPAVASVFDARMRVMDDVLQTIFFFFLRSIGAHFAAATLDDGEVFSSIQRTSSSSEDYPAMHERLLHRSGNVLEG
jgi:hypothetical protein